MTNRANYECLPPLIRAGISHDDALALRKIAMTLHRWHELECGVDGGGVDRDDETGVCWWYDANSGKRTHTVPDREKNAKRKLGEIMNRYYPNLYAYIQGDPRGASLYIIRKGDVPVGADVSAYYSRGLAVYK